MLDYINTNSDRRDVTSLDGNVERVFDSIVKNPLLNNPTLISDIVFVSGVDQIVSHQLNRVVKGYIVVKASAAASLYTSSTALINPTAQIILKTNANATLSILFF